MKDTHLLRQFIFFFVCLFTAGGCLHAQNPGTSINCIQNDLVNNNIRLYWDSAAVPACGPFVEYRLYGAPVGSPASLLHTASFIDSLNFTLVGALSIDNDWYFYISVVRDCPLANESVFSDTVVNSPPDIPQINFISNENGFALLDWEPSEDPKTCFYVIYYNTPSGIIRWDTVWGRLNTQYLANPGRFDADLQAVSITVEANDCCGNNNGPNRDPDISMFLQYSVDRCNASIDLNWSAYYGWDDSLLDYRVYLSVNGAAFSLLSTVDSSLESYSHTGFNDQDSLCFFVVARHAFSGDTSKSNLICMTPSIVQGVSTFFLTNLTVNNNNDIQVSWVIDTMAELLSYSQEQQIEGDSFVEVQSYPVPTPLNFYDTIIDSLAAADQRYYYERMSCLDSCGNPSISSVGRSIYLKAELSNFYLAHMEWSEFQLAYATITGYDIYRDIGGGEILLASLPASQLSYDDDLSSFYDQKGVFCYRIKAHFDLFLPGSIGLNSVSESNRSCVDHVPVVHIPNAIRPNGQNRIFKPVIFFGDLSNYSLYVYNRWGQLLFESNNIEEGWDGKYKDKEVPEGGYVYVLKYRSVDGIDIQKQGMVMVLY